MSQKPQNLKPNNSRKQITFFGPFANEYSLSKVNRHTALAFAAYAKQQNLNWQVNITAIADAIGTLPSGADLAKYAGLKEIYAEYKTIPTSDILIYQNFPRDPNALHGLADLPANFRIVYLAWEEDAYPQRWVTELNAHANMVMAASEHTKRVLKRSGIKIPVVVVPNALMPAYLAANLDLSAANTRSALIKSKKKYLFLHNSSGMERKSPKELLEGYVEAFTAADNVALVIKSFPNINNQFTDLVEQFRAKKNSPEIELIETADLSDEQLIELYQSANCYVAPSKAEGFNLPVLEAMCLGVPVISTGWSSQLDFLTEDNGYLVDYQLVPAQSHLDNPGAYWAEPSVPDLAAKFRQVYEEDGKEVQLEKIDLAHEMARNFTWEKSAELIAGIVADAMHLTGSEEELSLGVISTYNTVCGIAEYSSYLYGGLFGTIKNLWIIANSDAVGRVHVDTGNLLRLWEYGDLDFEHVFDWFDRFTEKEGKEPFKIAHIQYNVGFYTYSALNALIEGFIKRGVKVILTAHAVQIPGAELTTLGATLGKVWQIHVLNKLDYEFLEAKGLKNVHLFPHGNSTTAPISKAHLRKSIGIGDLDTNNQTAPVIATHGFLVENKGLVETLKAVKSLVPEHQDLTYLALDAVNPRNMTSQALSDDFSKQIKDWKLENNVLLVQDFLEKEDIITALQASDIAIFAYPEARETASGAVRLGMAAGVPIIVTKSAQLKDLHDIAFTIEDNKPETIAAAIRQLLGNANLRQNVLLRLREYSYQNNWDRLAIKYLKLIAEQ